jgi:hypothetical protein
MSVAGRRGLGANQRLDFRLRTGKRRASLSMAFARLLGVRVCISAKRPSCTSFFIVGGGALYQNGAAIGLRAVSP